MKKALICDDDADRVTVLHLFLKGLGYYVTVGHATIGVSPYLLETTERHMVLVGPGIDFAFLRVVMHMPKMRLHRYILLSARERTIPSLTAKMGARLYLFLTPLPLDLSLLRHTIAAAEAA